MTFHDEHKGEMMIVIESLFWSMFPVFTLLIYNFITPLFTYAWINVISTIFFMMIIVWKKNLNQLGNKKSWPSILWATLIITIFYHTLVFVGLQYTTAGNAAIVLLMEIFFSFLIFMFWFNEKHKPIQIVGSILMVTGAIIILFQGRTDINIGDALILTATIIVPFGNYFQQKARKIVSTETIMFYRGILGIPFFFILAFIFEPTPSLDMIKNVFPLLLVNGVFIFSISKLLWVEGIHRISVAKAASLNTVAPVFTLIFAYFILKELPSIWQITGIIPIIFGGILITKS